MSAALWPSLLLGLGALGVATWRMYVLAIRAPVDARLLSGELTRRLACDGQARALALCRALPRRWAADSATQLLAAEDLDRAAVEARSVELRASYWQRAQWGLGALQALGRMAFPLSLGSAIVVMSGAFALAEVSVVEAALSTALQCLTVGVMSAVFCRTSAALLQRQGAARLREIAAVCGAIKLALPAPIPAVAARS